VEGFFFFMRIGAWDARLSIIVSLAVHDPIIPPRDELLDVMVAEYMSYRALFEGFGQFLMLDRCTCSWKHGMRRVPSRPVMLCVPSVDPRISVGAIGSNWQIPLRLHGSPATGPLRRNKLAKGRAAREDIPKMHVARHWHGET